MNVIGIDASLTNTAVCIFDGARHHTKCFPSKPCGHFVCDRNKRYTDLCSSITSFIDQHEKPASIFIEGYAYGARCSREMLGEYGGVLRQAMCLVTVAVYEVPPTSLKLWATGKGKGDKTPMIAAITHRYGVQFESNDEYDAYALARFGWQFVGNEKAANETQRQAIERVLNGKQKKAKK